MKKSPSFVLPVLAAGAAAFAAFSLFVPFRRSAGFWIAFAAGLLAFALQFPVVKIVGSRSDYLKSTLLGLPLVKVGYLYLGIQCAVSFALFALGFIPGFPSWISAVLCAVLLFLALVCGISAAAVRDKILSIEERGEQSTLFMRALDEAAKKLCNSTSDPKLKKALSALEEDIRFSDPVSSDALIASENALICGMDALEQAVSAGKNEQAAEKCSEVRALLKIRNDVCRQYKKR